MPAELFLFLADTEHRVDRGEASYVWVADAAAAARVAAEHAATGVRLIELYGGFDLAEAGAVLTAVGDRAPVGFAGPLPRRGADTVALFNATDTARFTVPHAAGSTTVLLAPEHDMPRVAAAAVDAGATVVEVCGGTPATVAARVATAVGDRATVTVVRWPFESITAAAAYAASFP